MTRTMSACCLTRSANDPASAILCSQLHNGDGFAAAVVGFGGGAGDERMRREELGEPFAEGAGSVAVDYADAWAICQGSFVEELVDAIGGFFDRGADDVDFVSGGVVGRFRCDRDIEARRRYGCRSRRRTFDAGNLIDGDFHAQRASFDFGGVAVDAAQDDRFAETADADFGAGLETGGAWRVRH